MGKHCDASDDYGKRCCHCRPAHSRAVLLQGLELFWKLRIADLIRVKVYHRDAHAVFHFAFAEIVQEGSPLFVFS